jgi:hypothetical protein
MDHPAGGVGAVEGGARPQHHLHPLQVLVDGGDEVHEVGPEGRDVRQAIVGEHVEGTGERVVEAPGHHVRRLDSVLDHVHRREPPKVIHRRYRRPLLDGPRAHHRHRCRRLKGLVLPLRDTHHQGVELERPSRQGRLHGGDTVGLHRHSLQPPRLVAHDVHRHQVVPGEEVPQHGSPRLPRHPLPPPGTSRAQGPHARPRHRLPRVSIPDRHRDGAHLGRRWSRTCRFPSSTILARYRSTRHRLFGSVLLGGQRRPNHWLAGAALLAPYRSTRHGPQEEGEAEEGEEKRSACGYHGSSPVPAAAGGGRRKATGLRNAPTMVRGRRRPQALSTLRRPGQEDGPDPILAAYPSPAPHPSMEQP